MQTFDKKSKRSFLLELETLPDEIRVKEGHPAVLVINGKQENAFCLKCESQPCIKADVISASMLGIDFSTDNSTTLCPVDAIHWDEKKEKVHIDSTSCIGCGLCASRCPMKAIYKNPNEITYSVSNIVANALKVENNKANRAKHLHQIEKLKKIESVGQTLSESNDFLLKLQSNLSKLSPSSQNLFVKNVLNEIGGYSLIRRTGDNSFRMDGLVSFELGAVAGPLEVEFGDDCLSAIRLILDDICVLHSRHGLNAKKLTPLVIFHHMPNVRQGYWQVCQDIYAVTGIKVYTLTLLSLLLLMWNKKNLADTFTQYYLDTSNQNLMPYIEKSLGRKLKCKIDGVGIFAPIK